MFTCANAFDIDFTGDSKHLIYVRDEEATDGERESKIVRYPFNGYK